MTLFYAPLLSVAIENDYYGDLICSDLALQPTLETAQILKKQGWILRGGNSGFKIIARVKPDANNKPSKDLFNALDASELPVLRFIVSIKNANFCNFTDIDKAIKANKKVFYLNNIYDFNTDKGRFLKNSAVLPNPVLPNPNSNSPTNDVLFGTSIKWLNQTVYRNSFAVAANVPNASVTIRATHLETNTPFDLGKIDFTLPAIHDAQTVEYSVDLSKIDNISEGRYQFSDDKGNNETIFYAPDSYNESVTGVIELFSKTGNQPFLKNDLANGFVYKMRFKAKDILLQYIVENVTKDALSGEIKRPISKLDIQPYTITVEKLDTKTEYGKVSFLSFDTMKWRENLTVPILTYKNGAAQNFKLPQPSPNILPELFKDERPGNEGDKYCVKIFITL